MSTIETLTAALADHYRVQRELGAGGMATVYLARDLKHDRDVAIKVLHPELAAALGSERFLSEIKTTARLQHPHILPLLDSGAADGLLYYVMPFVAGETLRARLDRERQLPIPDAIRLAREVAGALDYAHRHGVIHRDIKPENVLLHDGSALVADFGIALAVQTAGGQRMTQTGLSLGTPQYMSPEQAMGERSVDSRTDIYALGAVTYEMLAGDAPFTGSSVQAIVAKVLNERPTPLHMLRDTVPAGVEDAVLTALAKLPADRFATGAQFAAALSADGGGLSASRRRITAVAGGPWRGRAIVASGVALIAAIIAVAGWLRPSRSAGAGLSAEGGPVTRVAVAVAPANAIWTPSDGFPLDLSPDGTKLAYSGRGPNEVPQVWIRSLDALEPVALPGSQFAATMRWAPDGRALYLTGGVYPGGAIVPTDGSPPIQLPVSKIPRMVNDAAFGAREHVYFVVPTLSVIVRQTVGGGVDTVFRNDSTHAMNGLSVRPDERVLTFIEGPRSSTEYAAEQVVALDLRSGRRATLTAGVFARILGSGHLLWVLADGTAMVAPFDAGALRLTGSGTAIAKVALYNTNSRVYPAISASDNGTLVYLSGLLRQARVSWLQGTTSTPLPTPIEGDLWGLSLSPDGAKVAYSLRRTDLRGASGSAGDVWVQELKTGGRIRLTSEKVNMRPSWSPDGKYVIYARVGGTPPQALLERRADASEPERVVLTPQTFGHSVAEGHWMPDHRTLIVRTYVDSGGSANIFAFTAGTDSVARPIAISPANESAPRPSPDGSMIAYTSDETGARELYVQAYPSTGNRIMVSQNGATTGQWSRDSKRLMFWDDKGKFVEVVMQARPSLAVLSRKVLPIGFSLDLGAGGTVGLFDVAPDGRILAAERLANTFDLVLVRNWMAAVAAGGEK